MQTSYITNNSQSVQLGIRNGSIDLSAGSYSVYAEGIYIVTNGGSSSYQIQLNSGSYNASTANGQTVIIVNQDPLIPVATDLLDYPILDSGVVYKFVSDGGQWLKVPTPGAMYANGNFPGINEIVLPKAGVYVINIGKPDITLPNASEYDGQTIIIFNITGDYTCYVRGGVYDFDNSIINPFEMGYYSMLKLKSVGGNWRLVKYSFA